MARLDIYATDRVLELFQLFLVLQSIQFCTVHGSSEESHNQAFIQTDKHLTYIVGDNYLSPGVPLEISPGSPYPDLTLHDDNFFPNNIRLDPPMLDFQDQPVGMPRMEKVIVQNNDPKHSLHLFSISGSTLHFHCSFFQDKIVPPGGNTSFDVVFLARQVGNVENTLFVHTSIGSIRYQVFGVGIPNPYRLRPYLGARVPINSSFTPVIQMHNPYSTSLQVLEMFASEGDLHLELPSGEREASKELWELKPFETKAVMKANFVARVESNHSAFIRIKTNKEESSSKVPELLILPLEIEVSSDPGIYSPVELLDFGILRTLDEPKTLRLNLVNTGLKAIHITSVSVSPPNNAVNVDFRPFKLQPDGTGTPTTVAHITFTAVKALQSKQWSGKVVIKTKNNIQRLVIPYQANVLHGSLVYNVNSTHFFSAKALWNVTRPMTFTNTFNFSLVIYNVSLPPEVSSYFSILNFSEPVIVEPQQSVSALLLKFHPNRTQIHFNSVLTLHTNASTFTIPITVYNGQMKFIQHRPEKFEGQLDFGTLGVGERRHMIFTIRNDNPVDVVVAHFEPNTTWAKTEILGMEKGNGTTLTRKHNKSEITTDPLYIKPYHYAVFNVSIVAPEKEGAYVAEIWIFTQFQDLFVQITFRAAKGSLHAIPDKFVFEKVYPGRVPYKVLQIHSTFDDYMEVTQVSFQPADTRFYFVRQNSNAVLLKPQEHSIIGKIYFDAKKICKDDCYVGLPTLTPAGHQWLLGLSLDKDVADTDQYLYTKLRQKWERLDTQQNNMANVTIELDTNQVRGFLFSAQAHLHWPSLVRKARIKYPLTQIGNLSVSDFIVENPGDDPVLVQVLPLSLYPNPHTILDLMSQRFSQDFVEYVETEESNAFVLYDLEHIGKGTSTSANSLAQHRKTVESSLGVIPHRQTLAALLQPGGKLKVKVGFLPKDDLARSSLIVIRNNLTIIDAVVVQGQGCKGEMRFNNKKPGSFSPLAFEMTEKHLKNCDTSEKKANKNIYPNFTVRRPFTLRNPGELSFFVHSFSINGLPCEGYGFKVLDCSPFEMPPNSSRKINIAFTPDFTMSQIQRMLTIHSSLSWPASQANYSLQAMVPYDLLSQCSAALPRPAWEPLLYYVVLCLMVFFVCLIMVLAYFESNRVIGEYVCRKQRLANTAGAASNGMQGYDKGKVFDLRNVPGAGGGGGVSATCGTKSSGGSPGSHYPNGRVIMNGHGHIKDGGSSPHHLNNHHHNNSIILNAASSPGRNSSGRRSFMSNFLKIFKSISVLKYFGWFTSKKSPCSQQDKKDSGPEVAKSPSSPPSNGKILTSEDSFDASDNSSPTSASAQDPSVLAEKSLPTNGHTSGGAGTSSSSSSNYQNGRGRKGRLNQRRQIVVDAAGDTNTAADPSAKKQKENKDPSSSGGELKKPTSTVGPGMAMIDDFEEVPSLIKYSSTLDQLEDLDDIDGKVETRASKSRGGSKRNKSKTKSEGSSKDHHMILRRESTATDDVDDVSSTTTESSGGDVEEKSSLCQDSTPELTNTTTVGTTSRRWKRGQQPGRHGGSERLMVVATHGGDLADDDQANFEVTSKSKAHRKIRVNKETFGGDIMRPSTIELPYCLPKEKQKAEHETSKRPKKPKKTQKSDLSDLSIQTEKFAQRLSHPSGQSSSGQQALYSGGATSGLTGFGSGPNSPVSGAFGSSFSSTAGSGRPSSYSSIVSSSTATSPGLLTSDPMGQQPAGNLGSGVMWSAGSTGSGLEGPRFGSGSGGGVGGFNPFAENGLPGIMAPGLVQGGKASSGSPVSLASGWSSMAPPVSSVDSGYGLHPLTESSHPSQFSMAGPRGPMDGFSYGNLGESSALYPGSMYPSDGSSLVHPQQQQQQQQQPQQLTMMQQLRAERRRRLWEHQQKLNSGEEWPGFSTPLLHHTSSLWDNDYNPNDPHNTWSTAPDQPGGVPPNGFWSTLTNSASNGWSSLQSLANIWGNNTPGPHHHHAHQHQAMASQALVDPTSTATTSLPGGGGALAAATPLMPVGVGGSTTTVFTPSGQHSPQLASTAPAFNLFTSMADIWSPTSGAPTSTDTLGVGPTTSGSPGPIGSLGGLGAVGSPPSGTGPIGQWAAPGTPPTPPHSSKEM